MSLGKFDALLGRLRTDDTVTINTTRNVTQGMGSASTAGVSVQTGTTVPATGSEGDIFYDTDDAVLYIYAGGTWNAISGGGGPVTGTWDFIDGSGVDFIDGSVGDFVV